jgi:hypothetical protein
MQVQLDDDQQHDGDADVASLQSVSQTALVPGDFQ